MCVRRPARQFAMLCISCRFERKKCDDISIDEDDEETHVRGKRRKYFYKF